VVVLLAEAGVGQKLERQVELAEMEVILEVLVVAEAVEYPHKPIQELVVRAPLVK
jgi:hypothetical protein